jgi:hypothetical protein
MMTIAKNIWQESKGLFYIDQFKDSKSLSEQLSNDLNGKQVSFDFIDLYDIETSQTIMDGALIGYHTYDDILKQCKKFYKL